MEAAAPEQIRGYRDLEEIGRGGFSTVYRARQESLGRVVALKVLHVDLRRDRDAERRFRRECVLSGLLSAHPHVLTVLEGDITPRGSAFIASEYCPRGSLADRIAADGRLPLDEVLRYGQQIASALDLAHSHGVLHRDVKPENILLTEFGQAALTDFGIASVAGAGALSMSQQALTAHHAPPELLETTAEVPPSPAADVYSLGSTLWTLASGRPPFMVPGGSWIQFVHRVVSGDLPRQVAPDVPESVRSVLAAAMATDPQRRLSARQLGEQLAQLQQQLTGAAQQAEFVSPAHTVERRDLPGGGGFVSGAAAASGTAAASQPSSWSDAGMPGYANAYTGPAPGASHTSFRRFEEPEPPAGWGAPAPASEGPRPRRQLIVAGVALLVLALGVGAALALLKGSSRPSVGAGAPSAPAASVAPQVADASRATAVTVQRSGGTAVLHWTNGTGYSFLAVKQDPVSPGSAALTVITDPSATTTTVSNLTSAQRYCWTIVSVVEPGNPPVTSSSQQVCG